MREDAEFDDPFCAGLECGKFTWAEIRLKISEQV
jgi:hypothetical protein